MANETNTADGGAPSSAAAQDTVLETAQLVDIVWGKLMGWAEALVEMLPNLAVAILIVLFFAILARLAQRFVGRVLERISSNDQIASLAGTTARIATLCLGLFLALGVLELEKTVTSLLAGVGVVGLALGFAFQDIASNFMSGVIMAIRRPFELGETVETGGVMGNVERVNLRATVIRNFGGQLVIIPNKDVLQNPIINYTRSGARRVEIPVGVGYESDLEQVREVAREAMRGLPGIDESEDIDVIYTGFGGSSIDLEVRFWLDLHDDQASYLEAKSLGIMSIKTAFEEAGIGIPYPIRTIQVPAEPQSSRKQHTRDDEAEAAE